VWLGFSRSAGGEWQLVAAWPGGDADLIAAIGWLDAELAEGEARRVEAWRLARYGDPDDHGGPASGLAPRRRGSREDRRGPRYDGPVMEHDPRCEYARQDHPGRTCLGAVAGQARSWPKQMVAPCGCVTRVVGRTLTLAPCPQGRAGICPNAAYVRMAAIVRRKPVVILRPELS
jgi:hypothetical protein